MVDRSRSSRRWMKRMSPLLAVITVAGTFLLVTGPPPSASAAVTTVKGSAFGYFSEVGLFGGPQKRRGFGQFPCSPPDADTPTGCVPQQNSAFTQPAAESASPSVDLPTAGGDVSATDADGARADYGPATIFGGKQCVNCTNKPFSGPITVTSKGTTGVGGSTTSSADITLRNGGTNVADPGGVGPDTFVADRVFSTCAASDNNGTPVLTASTMIVNGILQTDNGNDQLGPDFHPAVQVVIPTDPPPNYSPAPDPMNPDASGHLHINGAIDYFKDVFNEQITNSDGSVTVNAFHEYLLGPTAVGNLVVSSSTCGVTAAMDPVTTTSSTMVGATTSSTMVGATTTSTSSTVAPTTTTSTTRVAPTTTSSSTTSTTRVAPTTTSSNVAAAGGTPTTSPTVAPAAGVGSQGNGGGNQGRPLARTGPRRGLVLLAAALLALGALVLQGASRKPRARGWGPGKA